jgi:putative oxidoreductase
MWVNETNLQAWATRMLSVLRIMAAVLFLQYGLSKYFGFPANPPPKFDMLSLIGLAGAIELVPLHIDFDRLDMPRGSARSANACRSLGRRSKSQNHCAEVLAGSLLLLVGLYSREAAFIMSGEIAVACFMRRAPNGLFPQVNAGGLQVLFCFVFLFLFSAGPGPWSVDAVRRPTATI